MNIISIVLPVVLVMATKGHYSRDFLAISDPGRKFYHNLTDPINAILFNGDLSRTSELEKKLKWSDLVLYSTDQPLSNSSELLVSLAKFLRKFSAEHQLILSLRYSNGNKFMWSRMRDVYYDLSSSMSEANRTLIMKHLSAVVLDWQVDAIPDYYPCDRSYDKCFFSQWNITQHKNLHVKMQNYYSFPRIVKNFLQLVLGSVHIPVGIIFSKKQIGTHTFLKDQIADSDFAILGTHYQSDLYSVFCPKKFHQAVSSMVTDYIEFTGKKQAMFLVNGINEHLSHYQSSIQEWHSRSVCNSNDDYYSDYCLLNIMKHVLPYFSEYSKEFINQVYMNKYKVSAKLIMSASKKYKIDIMFGNMSGNLPTLKESLEEDRQTTQHQLIPYLNTTESQKDICRLIQKLTNLQKNHESVAVNLDAWRAMARNKHALENPSIYCPEEAENFSSVKNINATLYFQNDTSKFWKFIEDPVYSILKNYRNISGITLNTLLFTEESLQESTQAISNFINSRFIASSSFKIGCAIDFDYFRFRDFDSYTDTSEKSSKLFQSLVSKLCAPIFDKVSVMVWRQHCDSCSINLGNFPRYYENIFFARKIFMREFPEKQVIIQFTSSRGYCYDYDSTPRVILAEVFKAPILLNLETI